MTPIRLTIDGREVEVAPGQTLLDAARRLGIDIPTLCYLEQCSPATSCLACLVQIKINGQARMVPSCATKAQPGMVVESEVEEVRTARRTALELLLSDHVGDCLSPCHRICPLDLNVPVMFRLVEEGKLDDAIAVVRDTLPLAGVLGRICSHPCENGCRRGTWDQPAAIRDLERFVADASLIPADPYVPPCKPPTNKSVVVVGAGPAGLAAAFQLRRDGHACTVVDRHEQAGGSLRSQTDETSLPRDVIDRELDQLRRLGVKFQLGLELGKQLSLDGLARGFDAILLAVGSIDRAEAERIGLPLAANGAPQFNPETRQSALPRVYFAGSMIRPIKQVARAMSEGQIAASCIDQFLNERQPAPPGKPFSSIMGRVEKSEVELFARLVSSSARVSPSGATNAGFTPEEAQREAARCLHCDCRAVGECKLQHYAQIYGADATRFGSQRRSFTQLLHPGGAIYEPGKCIRCGICVQLTEKAREPLGLTFIGRGFDVCVGVPLNGTVEQGLKAALNDCVEHCPTGALEKREELKGAAYKSDTRREPSR